MPEITNATLLIVVALLYFAVLAGLFRGRHHIGLGAFFCALGVMHFIETYLASNLYVALPFGIVASPGSVVLFSGKLMLLLLVYIREDAAVVRQPIYGLLIGNLLTLVLAQLLALHTPVAIVPGEVPNLALVDQMGVLMVWGTVLLFVDCILLILLYEKSRSWFGDRIVLRMFASAATILSFDQLGFFAGLYLLYGADYTVMIGGWAMKMAAAALYAGLCSLYLSYVERADRRADTGPRIGDVFGLLTYRERYEALLARTGRDALTGTRDRGELETDGPRLVRHAIDTESDLTLFVIDIDHFKALNDEHGHAAGDDVLKVIAERITASVRSTDLVFRYGGEEFVVICLGLNESAAAVLGEHLRLTVARANADHVVTASIGFAACPAECSDYDALFQLADRRMYMAKAAGRNRVVGRIHESDSAAATSAA